MKKQHLIIAFAITLLAQILVPLKMIYDSQITERDGTEFKFKTVPIDPTDPFRGKYITLDYDIHTYATADTTFMNDERIYVSIQKGKDGFAQVASVSREEPNGNDYVIANVNFNYGGKLNIEFPFDRFYMAEKKAPEAEIAYEEYSEKKNAKPAYALVAVKEGNAVIKDVIVDGTPIDEYVNRKSR